MRIFLTVLAFIVGSFVVPQDPAPELRSTLRITSGGVDLAAEIQFGFRLSEKLPGRIPLEADLDWHRDGNPEVRWTGNAQAGRAFLTEQVGLSNLLLVYSPGVYTIQALAFDKQERAQTFRTITVTDTQ